MRAVHSVQARAATRRKKHPLGPSQHLPQKSVELSGIG